MSQTPIASINKVAEDTYRISIALPAMMPGGFSFNQYLVIIRADLRADRNRTSRFQIALHRVFTCRGRREREFAGVSGGSTTSPACMQRSRSDDLGQRYG